MHSHRNQGISYLLFSTILFVLTLPSTISIGQDRYVHIGLNEGLDNLVVNDIEKDNDGFIWLATNGGLKRYDGEHFKTLSSLTYSFLKNGLVNDIYLDENILWISYKNRGLFRYEIDKNEINYIPIIHEEFQHKNINHISSFGNYLYLSLDRSGLIAIDKTEVDIPKVKYFAIGSIAHSFPLDTNLVIISPYGDGFRLLSNSFDKNPIRLDRVIEGDTILDYTCSNSLKINDKIWWACWDNALHSLALNDYSSKSFLLPDESKFSLNSDEINDLVEHDGNIIVACKSGKLYSFNIDEKKYTNWESSFFEGVKINTLFLDETLLWIGTDEGIYSKNISPKIFTMHKIHDASQKSLVANVIEFHKGELIFGALNGTYKFKNGQSTLIHPRLSEYSSHALLSDNDDLYVGTNKSVFKFEEEKKPIQNVFDVEIVRAYTNYYDPTEVKFSRFSSLAIQETVHGRMLWAMAFGHFPAFKLLGEDWAAYAELYGDVEENLINNIVCDSNNQIHILGRQRGYYENVRIGSIYCEDDEIYQALPLKWQYEIDFPVLYADTSWNISNTPEMPCNDVHDIAFRGKFIYLATSSGFIRLSEDRVIRKYDLPFNDISRSMYWKNKMWLIGSGKLMMLDPETEEVKLFNDNAGIPNDFQISCLKARGDSIYIGGKGWLGSAHSEALTKETNEEAVLKITSIKALKSDKAIPIVENEICVNESEKGLLLSFASLLYPQALDVNYQYRLEDINDNWVDNGLNNDLILPNLTPGFYNLRVRAVKQSGDQIGNLLNIGIEIDPVWYRSVWFNILILVMGLCLLYGVYRYRVNQLLEVTRMRNEISHDLHDDIGSILSSISIYADSAESALINKDPRFAKKIIDKIGHQSRLTIDKMSDIVWSINSNRDSLFDLLDRMEIYGNEVCSAKGVEFNFHKEGIQNDKMNMKKRKNIFLIFKEVLSNALKHSNCSVIEIKIVKDKDKIHLTIMDNGDGFDKKVIRQNGFGLSTMTIRAKDMNAELHVVSNINKGTKVSLTV